jgi:hypothetical protein
MEFATFSVAALHAPCALESEPVHTGGAENEKPTKTTKPPKGGLSID